MPKLSKLKSPPQKNADPTLKGGGIMLAKKQNFAVDPLPPPLYPLTQPALGGGVNGLLSNSLTPTRRV